MQAPVPAKSYIPHHAWGENGLRRGGSVVEANQHRSIETGCQDDGCVASWLSHFEDVTICAQDHVPPHGLSPSCRRTGAPV